MNDSSAPRETLIEALDVQKIFASKSERLQVLSGTSLRVYAGEIIGIVGSSGAGKSTFLHILGGLDHPTSGKVLFRGKDVFAQGDGFLEMFRNRHVGFVFQAFNLMNDFTALENAMFPALIGGMDRKTAREKAERLLCEVGLKDRLRHRPGELSGGEGQRVALARGLVNQPDLLLADEPTGNLDAHSSDALMQLIRNLNKQFNQTFVIVTHSQKIARKLDRVFQLHDGKLDPIAKEVII
ncbi:MAG: ABC transporter ATP-binding protein [Nitrospinae bacterium]|nr:ABC transporter ATP-binding protein [Nitrospinota bacterium]